MSVSPRYRGKGIGKKLYNALETFAVKTGYDGLLLAADTDYVCHILHLEFLNLTKGSPENYGEAKYKI